MSWNNKDEIKDKTFCLVCEQDTGFEVWTRL